MTRWESGVRESARRLAWLLAKSSPSEAIKLAERACELSGQIGAADLDALAAAQAAGGDFKAALATARKALFWAKAHGDSALAKEIAGRIRLYEANQARKGRLAGLRRDDSFRGRDVYSFVRGNYPCRRQGSYR